MSDRGIIKLEDLTNKQKNRLIQFYKVSSIDELEVDKDGNITVKKVKTTDEGVAGVVGGSKTKSEGGVSSTKLYIQDHDGKDHELSIDEFLDKQKNPSLGFDNLDKDEARMLLDEFISKVIKEKKVDDMKQLCIEHMKGDHQLILFQQLVIFYSKKLRSVLCSDQLNADYIKATGNPGFSEIDFYNIIKKSDTEMIIKGFAFCTFPNKNELYINTICGTGGTGHLIKTILDSIQEKQLSTKAKYLALDSIETPEALGFYSKLGFRKTKPETLKTIKSIIKSSKINKKNSFEDYTDNNPKEVGGKLYLFPHNKLGESWLKKLGCEWIYDPESWYELAVKLRSEKKSDKVIMEAITETKRTKRLEGEGMGSFFKSIGSKISSGFTKVKDTVVSGFNKASDSYNDGRAPTEGTPVVNSYKMPPTIDLYKMESESYGIPEPGLTGYKLIQSTPSLKIYNKINTDVFIVAIRGTEFKDKDDIGADVSIAMGNLINTPRFKRDLHVIRTEQDRHPKGYWVGVGHSLGGAILDKLLDMGILKEGVSFNPAIEKSNYDINNNNRRIYLSTDPLYNLIGKFAKFKEVRVVPNTSIVNGHNLDNFKGGRK
jgi:hypothetical protein